MTIAKDATRSDVSAFGTFTLPPINNTAILYTWIDVNGVTEVVNFRYKEADTLISQNNPFPGGEIEIGIIEGRGSVALASYPVASDTKITPAQLLQNGEIIWQRP